MITQLTVKQIIDLGLWKQVCEYKGWDEWIYAEGQINENDFVTFDSEFKKKDSQKSFLLVKGENKLKLVKLETIEGIQILITEYGEVGSFVVDKGETK